MDRSRQDLILRCCEGEAAAWAELWDTVERTTSAPIARILQRRGLDPTLTMDVLQELCIYLLEDDLRRLRRFRGRSNGEFESYLRTIATRFTSRIASAWSRVRDRESNFNEWSAVPDLNGSSEQEVAARLQELASTLTTIELSKLQVLFRIDEANGERYSERTLRRWRSELRKKCTQ